MSTEDYDDNEAPEEKNRTRRRDDTVELNGPFGIRVRTRGKDASLLIIVVLSLASIAYLIYEHHKDSTAQLQETKAALTAKMDEMVYILSLPQEERDRLNIAMPDSLRAKVGSESAQRMGNHQRSNR